MADDQQNQKQKIVLDTEGYTKPLADANRATLQFIQDQIKGFTESSKSFAQHTAQVQAWAASMKEDFKQFSSTLKENLATGAQALTLGLGTSAIRSAAGSAIDMALDAGKKFAELKSRVAGTEAQFNSWDRAVKQTAISTKTNLASLQDAFVDLSDSASPEQIVKFMDQIGQATMLAHGNGRGVSDFVKKSLQGQGREFNSGNVSDVLGGADVLRRKGTGFGSMEQAMSALGGLNQNSLSVNKLNERGAANLIAGASRATGDSGKATAAISALLDQGAKGQLQAVSAQLGSFKGANGQFTLSNLGGAQAQKQTRLGKDDASSLEIFKSNMSQSGIGGEAAEGLFRMIRNADKFNAAVSEAAADTKTLGASATEAGDNLKDTLQQATTKMVVGFEDILGGFQKPLNSLLSGHMGQALGEGQQAVGQMGAGIAAHPLLTAGALAATAAGGSLVSSLAGKLLGGGAGGGPAGLLGKVMGKGGAQHVWVDNADQIRTGYGASPIGGGPGTPGAPGAGGKMGFMGKALAVGAAAEMGYAIGGAINQYADQHQSTNAQGQSYNIFEKGIAKVIPHALGGMTSDEYNDTYNNTQKVVVEVHSTDGRFDVKPKKEDNVRSQRTH